MTSRRPREIPHGTEHPFKSARMNLRKACEMLVKAIRSEARSAWHVANKSGASGWARKKKARETQKESQQSEVSDTEIEECDAGGWPRT